MQSEPTPHACLNAPAVAKLLAEIGQRLSLAGENPYKARSYVRAAQGLMSLTVPLEDVVASDRLREIPGVGAALAKTIKHLHQHGTTSKLDAMRAELPASVLALSRIPGLPPNKVVQLHRKLGIASVEELEQACRDERIAPVKGLGAASEEGAGRHRAHAPVSGPTANPPFRGCSNGDNLEPVSFAPRA